MKKLLFTFWIFLFVLKSFSQQPPIVLPFMYGFTIPYDLKTDYEKVFIGTNSEGKSKYGYCTPEQITELTNEITAKNNNFDKQFKEASDKYNSINDTLVALKMANDIDTLNKSIKYYEAKKNEIYKTASNNVKDISYTSLYIVIVTSDFIKYSQAELDSIALYKAFTDGIQKFCNTPVSDTLSLLTLNQSGGVYRNVKTYRSLNMEIKGNAKSGTNVAEIQSYQPDRDFSFKVYEVQIFPFSKTTPDFSSLNKFNNISSTNTLYSIISFDVFSPSQSLSDFLQQQKDKYNLPPNDINRILKFCNTLKLAFPNNNEETIEKEKKEVKKIQQKLNDYDKIIDNLKMKIIEHKKIIERIINNQTDGKYTYSETNINQTIKTVINYFNSKLNSIELQLQDITQKKYYTDIIPFQSSTKGKIWEQIFEQMKYGDIYNNIKTIEQRIGADYYIEKKTNVKIISDDNNSNTTTTITKSDNIAYPRKLSKYWLYLLRQDGRINIYVISVSKLSKNSKIDDKENNKYEFPKDTIADNTQNNNDPQNNNNNTITPYESEKSGTFIDLHDNQSYKWVKIGEQVWMSENLNYKTENGSWCYDNKKENCDIYGRLYDSETAIKVCPEDWHLSTKTEWNNLISYLGGTELAAGKMKEAGTSHWNSPNTYATNSSGFTALPGGAWNGVKDDSFINIRNRGYWWEYDGVFDFLVGSAWELNSDNNDINNNFKEKSCGFSVRCVKDNNTNPKSEEKNRSNLNNENTEDNSSSTSIKENNKKELSKDTVNSNTQNNETIITETQLPDLIPYRKGDKWGFVDKNRNVVIPIKYANVSPFSEGLAAVTEKGYGYGFIDKNGLQVIPCKYSYAFNFSEGLARVNFNGKYGFIDKLGNEVIPIKYDELEEFSNDLALVKFNNKYGYVDKTGKEVISIIYNNAWNFSNGIALVKFNNKYGYVDDTGKEIIPCKFDSAGDFNEGFAWVGLNQKYGFIDKTGKAITSCKYDVVRDFNEGLATVEFNDKGGFIDETGKEVISCKYFNTRAGFSENLAMIVSLNGKCGFIDRTGKEVIPYKYDNAGDFKEGFAWVILNRKFGYIDNTGKQIVPFKYDNAGDFNEGIARVMLNNKWGFIDKTGKEITPCKYYHVGDFCEGFVKVVNLFGKDGYIDKNGLEYFED